MPLNNIFRLCIMWSVLFGAALAAEPDAKPLNTCKNSHPAEFKVLEQWRGTWDVRAINRRIPDKPVTYSESIDWILDGCYLRSETSRKSDGGQTMAMFWFDRFTKTYRYVFFDASGWALELPPAEWNEPTRTMAWKSSLLNPTSYAATVTFKDGDTMHWKSLWKNWHGAVILELEGTSTRRK